MYAFIQDVPANETMYRQIREKPGSATPPGLVAHIAIKRPTGLRYVDVWETQTHWDTFRDSRLEPAVGEVLASYGIPHDHSLVSFESLDVIDAWLGELAAAAR
jgi:hypothetical protein